MADGAPVRNPQGPVFKDYSSEHLLSVTRKADQRLKIPKAVACCRGHSYTNPSSHLIFMSPGTGHIVFKNPSLPEEQTGDLCPALGVMVRST